MPKEVGEKDKNPSELVEKSIAGVGGGGSEFNKRTQQQAAKLTTEQQMYIIKEKMDYVQKQIKFLRKMNDGVNQRLDNLIQQINNLKQYPKQEPKQYLTEQAVSKEDNTLEEILKHAVFYGDKKEINPKKINKPNYPAEKGKVTQEIKIELMLDSITKNNVDPANLTRAGYPKFNTATKKIFDPKLDEAIDQLKSQISEMGHSDITGKQPNKFNEVQHNKNNQDFSK